VLEQIKRQHPLAERELNRMNEAEAADRSGSHIITSSNADNEGDTSAGGLRSTQPAGYALQRGTTDFLALAVDASNPGNDSVETNKGGE